MPNAPLLSKEERKALNHARDRVRIDGAHNVTGCPRHCGAMCKYIEVLRNLETRGIKP